MVSFYSQKKTISLNYLVCTVCIFAKLTEICGKRLHCIDSFLLAVFFPSFNALQFLVYGFCLFVLMKAGVSVVKVVDLVTVILLSGSGRSHNFLLFTAILSITCWKLNLYWGQVLTMISRDFTIIALENQPIAEKL